MGKHFRYTAAVYSRHTCFYHSLTILNTLQLIAINQVRHQGPDSQKVSSLKSEIFLRFFSDLRPFAHLGFTKDLRLRFFSDLVSNLRLPRG